MYGQSAIRRVTRRSGPRAANKSNSRTANDVPVSRIVERRWAQTTRIAHRRRHAGAFGIDDCRPKVGRPDDKTPHALVSRPLEDELPKVKDVDVVRHPPNQRHVMLYQGDANPPLANH